MRRGSGSRHAAPGLRRALLAGSLLLSLCNRAAALDLIPVYTDDAAEGFNDPELGPPRRAAFEYALTLWGRALAGSVPVVVDVSMISAGGSGRAALLASTLATSIHRDFPGAPEAGTWYPAALANQIAGSDVNGGELTEISVQFNGDVDNPEVLGSIAWYYGTDAAPGSDIDFVSVALHELAHGLGFFSLAFDDGSLFGNSPAVYDRRLLRPSVGRVPFLSVAERTASLVSGDLFFDDTRVRFAFGGAAAVFAPDPYQPGSSVSHWDVSLAGELLVPFYLGPNRDPGLALAALRDIGWEPAGPVTETPKSTFTPTATRPAFTPRPTPTRPPSVAVKGYVSNFGDDTVSVFDTGRNQVVATVPVAEGPFGVAASPSGELVFVADYYGGAVSVIDTSADEVAATVAIAGAPHSVAFLPDRPIAYVSDTANGVLVEIDTESFVVRDTLPVGLRPAGLAAAPDGRRLFVALYGEDRLAVVDVDSGTVTARIGSFFAITAPVAVAVAPDGSFGYVSSTFGNQQLFRFSPSSLFAENLPNWFDEAGDLAITSDGRRIIATKPARNAVYAIDAATQKIGRGHSVRARPQGIALSPDGETLYVANSGDASVSVLDADPIGPRTRFSVGDTPMRIAIAVVPVHSCSGDCDGDGHVTVDELVRTVRARLDLEPRLACSATADAPVTLSQVIEDVRAALASCEGEP